MTTNITEANAPLDQGVPLPAAAFEMKIRVFKPTQKVMHQKIQSR